MKLTLELMRDHSDGIERRAELMRGRCGESTQGNCLLLLGEIEARLRQLFIQAACSRCDPPSINANENSR